MPKKSKKVQFSLPCQLEVDDLVFILVDQLDREQLFKLITGLEKEAQDYDFLLDLTQHFNNELKICEEDLEK